MPNVVQSLPRLVQHLVQLSINGQRSAVMVFWETTHISENVYVQIPNLIGISCPVVRYHKGGRFTSPPIEDVIETDFACKSLSTKLDLDS